MCTCVAGFANNGTDQQDCAIDVDECASSPCYNNGICTDLINNYTCACVSGYRDYDCETHIVPCVFEEDHCSNHSTCVHDAPGVYHCECHPGYSSDSTVVECSMEDYPCTTDPSDEGGDLANGGAACTEINECASSPCQVTWTEGLASGEVTNSDSCNDFVDFYTCTCEDGYAGFNCDVDLDECASYPCLHNATCTDDSFAYGCACVDGFSGYKREVDDNECASACVHEWCDVR